MVIFMILSHFSLLLMLLGQLLYSIYSDGVASLYTVLHTKFCSHLCPQFLRHISYCISYQSWDIFVNYKYGLLLCKGCKKMCLRWMT
jgi:hypothetical protein